MYGSVTSSAKARQMSERHSWWSEITEQGPALVSNLTPDADSGAVPNFNIIQRRKSPRVLPKEWGHLDSGPAGVVLAETYLVPEGAPAMLLSKHHMLKFLDAR